MLCCVHWNWSQFCLFRTCKNEIHQSGLKFRMENCNKMKEKTHIYSQFFGDVFATDIQNWEKYNCMWNIRECVRFWHQHIFYDVGQRCISSKLDSNCAKTWKILPQNSEDLKNYPGVTVGRILSVPADLIFSR